MRLRDRDEAHLGPIPLGQGLWGVQTRQTIGTRATQVALSQPTVADHVRPACSRVSSPSTRVTHRLQYASYVLSA